ncbi:DUF6565 domain-containing protein [Bacteroides sp.]|uniref:DUF6565 domain-containing protein n=1 Tax=Bacteroides sp. TaxID=29523 RepID=UPI00402A4465
MKKVLFLALVLAIATACTQTKESYLDGFKLFVENVQKNAQDYTKADWEKADEQFTKLKDSYNKFSEQMTSNEKDEIVKLESTYTALKLKKIKEGAKDAFEKAKDTAKDAAKDVKEGTQKAVKKGEKAMEGIKDGLKD